MTFQHKLEIFKLEVKAPHFICHNKSIRTLSIKKFEKVTYQIIFCIVLQHQPVNKEYEKLRLIPKVTLSDTSLMFSKEKIV